MTAHGPSLSFRLLLWGYFPFLGGLCLGLVGLGVFFLQRAASSPFRTPWLLAAAVVLVPVGHVFWTFILVLTHRREKDPMELRVPRKHLQGLYDLVDEVARRGRMEPPAEIRLGADTVAHIYEDDAGRPILVFGGLALATFTRDALAGIIAHELAHYDAGDTGLSRRGARRALVMAVLDAWFDEHPDSSFNPLIWLVRLYHVLYRLSWAALSRQQEYAADALAAELVGEEILAASLIHLDVTERLPWSRLSSIVEASVEMNQPMREIFAEQVRRARATTFYDWQEALQKELKKKTGRLDSHPALKSRLAALGVSPKKALKLALDQAGEPVRELIPAWEAIEAELTERLIAPYREYYLAKREAAQIMLGRPLSRS